MLIAGLGACLETDLKKVIALSTLRQLGLIIIAVGIGLVKLAYFHILAHALFKALLFMCAGNIIHSRNNTQDLRKIGPVIISMPITSTAMNTANLALCGAPFITGFYSKDLILETATAINTNYTILALIFLSTRLTVAYSLRLSFYICCRYPSYSPVSRLSDARTYSPRSLFMLTLASIVGGAVTE